MSLVTWGPLHGCRCPSTALPGLPSPGWVQEPARAAWLGLALSDGAAVPFRRTGRPWGADRREGISAGSWSKEPLQGARGVQMPFSGKTLSLHHLQEVRRVRGERCGPGFCLPGVPRLPVGVGHTHVHTHRSLRRALRCLVS